MKEGLTGIQKVIMAKKQMKMAKEMMEAKMEAMAMRSILKGKKK